MRTVIVPCKEALFADTRRSPIQIIGGSRFSGAEKLASFAAQYMPVLDGRHCTSDWIVDIDGDTARQRCYVILAIRDETATAVTTGVYDDVLQRTPQGWRFVHRKTTVD